MLGLDRIWIFGSVRCYQPCFCFNSLLIALDVLHSSNRFCTATAATKAKSLKFYVVPRWVMRRFMQRHKDPTPCLSRSTGRLLQCLKFFGSTYGEAKRVKLFLLKNYIIFAYLRVYSFLIWKTHVFSTMSGKKGRSVWLWGRKREAFSVTYLLLLNLLGWYLCGISIVVLCANVKSNFMLDDRDWLRFFSTN